MTTKPYRRIGEVARELGVEQHVVRFWETQFPDIRVARSRHGQRVYSPQAFEKLSMVRELLYGEGYTIAGAKRQLRLRHKETA